MEQSTTPEVAAVAWSCDALGAVSASMDPASARGADLRVLTARAAALAGRAAALAGGRVQASVSDTGGTVHLKLGRPQRARYLLIWFTLLPPDSAGTSQESIYDVRAVGRPWHHSGQGDRQAARPYA